MDKTTIIGVLMDLGADRRGVDMGPSAIRVASLNERLRQLGYEVIDAGNIAVRNAGDDADPRPASRSTSRRSPPPARSSPPRSNAPSKREPSRSSSVVTTRSPLAASLGWPATTGDSESACRRHLV
jgi:hypothetical protein